MRLSTMILLFSVILSAADLPVKRVVLYKNGIGYFEHHGQVQGNQDVEIALPSSQLNDVLKSLTVLDLGGGQVRGISFDSSAPLSRRLAEIPVQTEKGVVEFLNRINGTEVELRTGVVVVSGKLMGAEVRRKQVGEYTVKEVVEVAVFTAQGDLRTVELTPATALRVVEKDLAGEVRRYLDLLDASHRRDIRQLKIRTTGSGTRALQVSYTSEAPVWKTTYRVVLDAKRKPLLQGWAIVDNTTPTDWTDVELSLVSGAPVSFVQDLAQPLYSRRPVVPMPSGLQVTPQTHQATLELPQGESGIGGMVADPAGAAVPNARVTVRGVGVVTTDSSGQYRVAVQPGTYSMEATMSGFRTATASRVEVTAGRMAVQNFLLQVGSVSEAVEVTATVPTINTSASSVRRGSGALALRASPAEVMREAPPETATSQRLGDQFEYGMRQPVTIQHNQSALLPIVHTEVDGEKVTLYNENDRRPLLAVWLKNSTALTLDGGSFTVIDSGAYAGEGLINTIHSQERRLLSYGLDLALEVSERKDTEPETITKVSITRGVMRIEKKQADKRTFVVRNNDEKPRTVLVEHPIRAGWQMVGNSKPVESSAGYHRFRVDVQPKTTAELVVREENPDFSTVAVTDVELEQVEFWVKQRSMDPVTEQALRSILALKTQIAAVEAKLEPFEDELDRINKDQQRVRDNLGKLGQSKEESNLRQRYVRDMEQQEDRLAQIRVEQKRLEEEKARLEQQLANLIAKL